MNARTNIFVASSDSDRSICLICRTRDSTYAERQTDVTMVSNCQSTIIHNAEVASRADDADIISALASRGQ